MEKNVAVIILAAGKGKRMLNPEKSKVMFPLKGKPMLEYVIDLSLKIDAVKIVPIVGHRKEDVIKFVSEKFVKNINKLEFAHQDSQLGTGHAVMQTESMMRDFKGLVLILSGDVPLLKYETVKSFIDFHFIGGYDASLLSAIFEDPSGYGRIVRDEAENFIKIVEDKDADEDQKKIKEINSGIYIIDNEYLFEALKTLKTNNSQGEYYLTDVFSYFKDKGLKIGAVACKNNLEITGVNTVEQLREMEKTI
ncbi:sugar phosphate nucleotidyltransferase [soil metagenome]